MPPYLPPCVYDIPIDGMRTETSIPLLNVPAAKMDTSFTGAFLSPIDGREVRFAQPSPLHDAWDEGTGLHICEELRSGMLGASGDFSALTLRRTNLPADSVVRRGTGKSLREAPPEHERAVHPDMTAITAHQVQANEAESPLRVRSLQARGAFIRDSFPQQRCSNAAGPFSPKNILARPKRDNTRPCPLPAISAQALPLLRDPVLLRNGLPRMPLVTRRPGTR